MTRQSVLILITGTTALTAFLFILTATTPKHTTPAADPPEQQTDEKHTADGTPYTVIADNLKVPWDIAFRPDGGMYVTERDGTLNQILSDGSRVKIPIDGVYATGESGLLGITLHPKFNQQHKIYLYMTRQGESGAINRIERFTALGNTLTDGEIIVDNIPGARYHDGGRIAFGPDGYLYITTGDASDPNTAQNKESLAGKILRVTEDGSAAPGNPFGTQVYSMGHRNPQGIAWDKNGNLWSTEHGRSGLASGLDEINKIEAGKNYGWPTLQGDAVRSNFTPPKLHSGDTTWAPASAAFINETLLFGGLRGEALYAYNTQTGNLRALFKHEFGRIRTVRYRPKEKAIYFTTGNTDGRGKTRPNDDKIIRIPIDALDI